MSLLGVIWDMDGVLVDTRDGHYESWVVALQRYQIAFSEQQFRDTFGMNNRGILQTLLGVEPGPEFVQEVSDLKEGKFRELIRGRARLLPGVRRWLEAFQASGLPMAIASSAPQANIDALVDELHIRNYFEALVSGFDLPGKPDPVVFLKAAALIQAPAPSCLVIEDAIAGVRAAQAAGMKCIAVTTTVSANRLQAAQLALDSLEELTPEMLAALFID